MKNILHLLTVAGFWAATTICANAQTGNVQAMQGEPIYKKGLSKLAGEKSEKADAWYENILNIEISAGNNAMDNCLVYFLNGATPGYDGFYDAQKMESAATVPYIYTMIDYQHTERLGVNGQPSLVSDVEIPLNFRPGYNGQHTLSFYDVATFPASTIIYLEDQVTHTFTNLRITNTYTFTAQIGNDVKRFMLHFKAPLVFSAVNSSCADLGQLHVANPGSEPWLSYDVYPMGEYMPVQSGPYTNPIVAADIPAGSYYLSMIHTSGYMMNDTLVVTGIAPFDLLLESSQDSAEVNTAVGFTTAGPASQDYAWNFGDGNIELGGPAASHIYVGAGTFNAEVSIEIDDCSANDIVSVVVTSPEIIDTSTTGINVSVLDNISLFTNGNTLYIDGNMAIKTIDFALYDLAGRLLREAKQLPVHYGRTSLNVELNTGVYIAKIAVGKVTKVIKLGFIN